MKRQQIRNDSFNIWPSSCLVLLPLPYDVLSSVTSLGSPFYAWKMPNTQAESSWTRLHSWLDTFPGFESHVEQVEIPGTSLPAGPSANGASELLALRMRHELTAGAGRGLVASSSRKVWSSKPFDLTAVRRSLARHSVRGAPQPLDPAG